MNEAQNCRDGSEVATPADFAQRPFLIGSGALSDLDVAMARDPALEEMVRAFTALTASNDNEITGSEQNDIGIRHAA